METQKLERTPEPGAVESRRATPLRPVVWMTSVLAWATVVALIVRVPTWAGVFFCSLTGISFLMFLAGYVYLFVNDRDALRAERWHAVSGRATLRDVPDHELQASGEARRRHLVPQQAQVPPTRPLEGNQRLRVSDAGGRTTE